MHVTLLHNPKAGGGEPSRDELVGALLNAGHAVTYQSTKEEGLEHALEAPGDVVLVAGGDGTVRKAAARLIGRGVPMALLPLGTANNIFKTLVLSDTLQDTIDALPTARGLPFDAGTAKGAWGETHFLEGVGLGAFPITMCLAENRAGNRETRAGHEDLGLTRDLRYFGRVLRGMKPINWQIEADGEDLSGRYYLCEVMNIRSVGPNLLLAPSADPADGLLDLVLVSERERPRVLEYVAQRASGRDMTIDLEARRVRHVTIAAAGAEVHIDDRLERPHEKPSAMGGLVDITLLPGALQFLSA